MRPTHHADIEQPQLRAKHARHVAVQVCKQRWHFCFLACGCMHSCRVQDQRPLRNGRSEDSAGPSFGSSNVHNECRSSWQAPATDRMRQPQPSRRLRTACGMPTQLSRCVQLVCCEPHCCSPPTHPRSDRLRLSHVHVSTSQTRLLTPSAHFLKPCCVTAAGRGRAAGERACGADGKISDPRPPAR